MSQGSQKKFQLGGQKPKGARTCSIAVRAQGAFKHLCTTLEFTVLSRPQCAHLSRSCPTWPGLSCFHCRRLLIPPCPAHFALQGNAMAQPSLSNKASVLIFLSLILFFVQGCQRLACCSAGACFAGWFALDGHLRTQGMTATCGVEEWIQTLTDSEEAGTRRCASRARVCGEEWLDSGPKVSITM